MVFCCAWFEILILLDVWFLSMTTFCLGFWWFRLWITMTYIGEVFCYVWAVLCCPVHPAGGLWSVLGVWMCNGSMESVKLMGMLFLPVAFPIHEAGAPSLILYTRGTWLLFMFQKYMWTFFGLPHDTRRRVYRALLSQSSSRALYFAAAIRYNKQ